MKHAITIIRKQIQLIINDLIFLYFKTLANIINQITLLHQRLSKKKGDPKQKLLEKSGKKNIR